MSAVSTGDDLRVPTMPAACHVVPQVKLKKFKKKKRLIQRKSDAGKKLEKIIAKVISEPKTGKNGGSQGDK